MCMRAIFGVLGPGLRAEDRAFIREANPWGFILFARNIETPEQVSALVSDLRDCVGREAPILLDQEGGRVARLKPPYWRGWPSVLETFRRGLSEPEAREVLRLRYRYIAYELRALGIDVCCTPLLDVPQPGAHDIIGDRALGSEPGLIAERGRVVCDALMEGGVLPVVKHLPGHGRAMADSHLALPVVDTDLETLQRVDFAPFRSLADSHLGMTAHIVYTALDAENCATLSKQVIKDIIRQQIGFDGLLMTDDLSMHALSGDFASRTLDALEAGCDVILHCNGQLAEMEAIASACSELEGQAKRRADAALAARRSGFIDFDCDQSLKQHNSLMNREDAIA